MRAKNAAAHEEIQHATALGEPTTHLLLGLQAERGSSTTGSETRARYHYQAVALGAAEAAAELAALEPSLAYDAAE